MLHSHLPYCRRAGRWPHGEEWLHEAASETYLPLLMALYDLVEAETPIHLTLGLTPVLVEQLADPTVLGHFVEYLEDKLQRAQDDVQRFTKSGEGHMAYLASFYRDRYQDLRSAFQERFGGNLIGAFKSLQDQGVIEIAGGAATHGYLPLLERDSSIFAQLAVGAQSYRHHFGRAPQSMWLPECAYRPAFYGTTDGTSYIKPGLEDFLAELGVSCFFAETHTIEGGEPVGKARGDAIGPYEDIPKRYVVPLSGYAEPTHKTTYLPYWVQRAEVAVLGRNNRTALRVGSEEHGYPGDYNYREFHKKDDVSGLPYWKVTGARVDLGEKDPYDPHRAMERVAEHSRHFAGLVEDLIADFHHQSGKFGIIAATCDTELFGHWWGEGVEWIKQVLQHLSHSPVVELTTANLYLKQHPPEDVLALPEGSWGTAGSHFTWLNGDTHWVWPIIHAAETTMEQLVAQHPAASGVLRDVLNQAGRELLLLQSSDWPFLITTGQAKEYATNRFLEHTDRFHQLTDMAQKGQSDNEAAHLAAELFDLDNVFPELDYRLFRNREGKGRSN